MNNISKTIGWANLSWNPITGCLGGCSYCYARAMARRFGRTDEERAFQPTFHPERLGEPERRKKPARIFVCSTSDLFGAGVEREWIFATFDAMMAAPRHTYQLLTKKPDVMASLCRHPPSNAWMGVTATDQASWDDACAYLAAMPGHVVRWISVEPLLGPIVIGDWEPDWVVIGLLSPRPVMFSAIWAGQLMLDLRARGKPVYVKSSVRGINCREWPRGARA